MATHQMLPLVGILLHLKYLVSVEEWAKEHSPPEVDRIWGIWGSY